MCLNSEKLYIKLPNCNRFTFHLDTNFPGNTEGYFFFFLKLNLKIAFIACVPSYKINSVCYTNCSYSDFIQHLFYVKYYASTLYA